jgi:glycosyltransferase involved in cell wall biosynthesis
MLSKRHQSFLKSRSKGRRDFQAESRRLHHCKPTVRILQIGNYPPPMCGWAMRTQLVQRELCKFGAECRVLDVGPNRRSRKQGCIPVHNGFDYALKLLVHRAKGYTFALHVNGDSWKGYLIALAGVLLGRCTGKPSFLVFHAGPKQLYFPRSHGCWFHAFRLLFRSSGSIVCNFEPVKNAIRQYGIPAEKIHPIPAFSKQYEEQIAVALAEPIERFLRAHEPRIFTYTLFRPEFTTDCLFQAFAEVRMKFPRAGLLLFGSHEVPPEVHAQLRRLGIKSSVVVGRSLAHAEFLTAIKRCDVFVRTHLRDGVCASILEALSLGVPVVAAEDGLRPPSVVTYAPADAADLARVLIRVLSNLEIVRAQVRPPESRNTLAEEVSLLLSIAGARSQ